MTPIESRRQRVRTALVSLPPATKTTIAISVDFVGITLCAFATHWLLSEGGTAGVDVIAIFALTAVIAIVVGWNVGLYKSIVRYMGFDLFAAGAKTTIAAAIVGSFVISLLYEPHAPVRWAIAFSGIAFLFICGSRFLARSVLTKRKARVKRERVIIYGAGAAGAQLAITLLDGDDYLPVAMIDDDSTLQNRRVKGISVYPPHLIGHLLSKFAATRVLLALPSASRRKRRKVLEYLSEHPVHVQTVPEINDLISGQANVDDIRDVDVNDLLGRDPVPPNDALLRASITGKSVLVTGAGGSIGSELCRQILRLGPKTLVLVDISEPALYHVERELRMTIQEYALHIELVPLLGSVHHEHRAREVIRSFEVDTVYHAAAYKHVPIVEHNIFEGIHNNVLGTLHAARAAIDGGADSFVLVSTDKAVNPTNVMGATKRMSELVLQAYNNSGTKTRFSMVRFGNVLESSGSVVPLFKEQIRRGGPVTVTHRDIIRYFMTIPEAAQLVIQAGAMARGGDVFVLDMGKPVKIIDLAYRMISLMGLTVRDADNPNGDIAIEFVGLRPAEKLYEELLIGSNVSGTEHPRIMRADEKSLPMSVLDQFLRELSQASQKMDFDRARNVLLSAVEEYDPQNGIDDLVWQRKKAAGDHISNEQVIDFPAPPKKT